MPPRLRTTPRSSPVPRPSSTMSMNMPQNTPHAVSNARSLFLRSVDQTSCQASRSNKLFAPQRDNRVHTRGAISGKEASQRARDHDQYGGAGGDAQADTWLAKERRFG